MHSFREARWSGYPPEILFDLVADVERYPEFVPLCAALTVTSRERLDDGRERLVANMTAAYKALHETFTSRVTLDRPARRIMVEYINGPFRHLENSWHFAPAARGGTDIEFFIAYEFRNFALQLVAGAVFRRAFEKFVDAFLTRAHALYGAPETQAQPAPAISAQAGQQTRRR